MQTNNRFFQSMLLYTIFIFYIFLVLHIILFKSTSPLELFGNRRAMLRSANLVPFSTINGYFYGHFDVSKSISFKNIVGNIILFVPLGIYLPLFRLQKKDRIHLFYISTISLSLELMQYIFYIGTFDIDDILLNSLGGFIGILLYKLLTFIIKDAKKIRHFITIISSAVGLLLFGLMLLLYISSF